jgi:hypothetical protein
MKTYFYRSIIVFVLAVLLTGCADRFCSKYTLELPDLPAAWLSILGEPWWRLEWIAPDGQKKTADFPPDNRPFIAEIEIPTTWANPVTAWPFWPSFNLLPGVFKPAGALFPFDADGSRLRLSWEAGVDTVFYWELAYNQNISDNIVRTPANFDWPRFRELFETTALSEAVREDPWLVDWRSLAERTLLSGFDRRRIVAQAVELNTFPVLQGPWYGTSPFATPLFFTEREPRVFPVLPGINVWISTEGILKANGNTCIFYLW